MAKGTYQHGQRQETTYTVRCCSKAEPQVVRLYDALKMEHAPFIRKKSVRLKIDLKKAGKADMLKDTR
jgi:hypothetical protein